MPPRRASMPPSPRSAARRRRSQRSTSTRPPRPPATCRGRDAAEDLRLEQELLADEKERAEHVMLIDLGRNDVGRVARIGTVRVAETMTVERYSHVMHLTSLVVGELAPDRTALDVLRA